MPPVRPTGRRVFNQQIVNTAPAVHRRAVFQGGGRKTGEPAGRRERRGREGRAGRRARRGRGEGAEKGAAREGARRGEAGAGRRARGEANGGTGKEAESQRGEGRGAARGETGAETGGENGDREGVNGDSAARTSDNIKIKYEGRSGLPPQGSNFKTAASGQQPQSRHFRASASEPPQGSSFRLRAMRHASTTLPTRSLPRMFCRWRLTVWTLMARRSATCLLVSPCSIHPSTSRSRSERSVSPEGVSNGRAPSGCPRRRRPPGRTCGAAHRGSRPRRRSCAAARRGSSRTGRGAASSSAGSGARAGICAAGPRGESAAAPPPPRWSPRRTTRR